MEDIKYIPPILNINANLNDDSTNPNIMVIKGVKFDITDFKDIESFDLHLRRNRVNIESLTKKDSKVYFNAIDNIRVYILSEVNQKPRNWPYWKDRLAKWFPEYRGVVEEENKTNGKYILLTEGKKESDIYDK